MFFAAASWSPANFSTTITLRSCLLARNTNPIYLTISICIYALVGELFAIHRFGRCPYSRLRVQAEQEYQVAACHLVSADRQVLQ